MIGAEHEEILQRAPDNIVRVYYSTYSRWTHSVP